ncbi:transmembrane protein, putative [Medicago truncatula]|uniref:Transmembrane protein, putative n=1 Tax=Medicago truncatula TaxID=3880 RepID=G7L5Z9_MEDTR|nr:transmembrane protein, putative [Medicago truncatula]
MTTRVGRSNFKKFILKTIKIREHTNFSRPNQTYYFLLNSFHRIYNMFVLLFRVGMVMTAKGPLKKLAV